MNWSQLPFPQSLALQEKVKSLPLGEILMDGACVGTCGRGEPVVPARCGSFLDPSLLVVGFDFFLFLFP